MAPIDLKPPGPSGHPGDWGGSTNTAPFSRREQRAPRGGLDRFHQVPRAPQKSWLPLPPTTGDHKTGTLRQGRLSIASAEAGAFPQQSPSLACLPTSLHGLRPTARQQPLLDVLCGSHRPGVRSVLPSGLSALAPLPALTPTESSGGTSSLLLECHTSPHSPASAPTGPPTHILLISKTKCHLWALGVVSSVHFCPKSPSF